MIKKSRKKRKVNVYWQKQGETYLQAYRQRKIGKNRQSEEERVNVNEDAYN